MPKRTAATKESDGDAARARAERPSVGRPPVISLDEILETAARLAEDVGVEGLTMGLVADELGVTSAALYHYVQNKQALVNKLFDRSLEHVAVPDPESGSWDQRLKMFQSAIRSELRRLKWQTPQPVTGDEDPPEAVARLASIVMDILSESGAEEHDVMLAFTLVYVYFTGQLWYDNSSRHMSFENHPHELRVEDDQHAAHADELFDFAFDIILAGLRERLTPKRGRKLSRRR